MIMHGVVLFILVIIWIPFEGSQGISYIHDIKGSDFNWTESLEVDLIIDGLSQIFDENFYNLTIRNVKSVNYLKSGMQRVGKSLVSSIQYFLSYLGLFRSNNKLVSAVHKLTNHEIRSATIKDEVLRQYLSLAYLIPLHSEISTRIHRYFLRSNYPSKGYARSNFDLVKDSSDNGDSWTFKWLNLIGKFYDFLANAFDCLDSGKWYDVKKAFQDLMKYRMNAVKKIITQRLQRPIPNHPKINGVIFTDHQAFICDIIVRDLKNDFRNCLLQVRAIDACSKKNAASLSSGRSQAKVSNILKKSMHSSIGSDCIVKKSNESMMKFCRNGLKSNLTKSFILLFSQSNQNRLYNSPNLEYMMDYVSRAVVKNKLIFNAFKDFLGMKSIFKPRAYGAHSKELRNHLSGVILRIIGRVHVMNTKIGKKLVEVSKDPKKVLSKNFRTMRCITKWIDKLLNRTRHQSLTRKLKHDKNVDAENGEGNPLRYHEKSIRELVVSMRSLSELNLRKSSTIFTLANTFLLATVFYECISILVTLMYHGDNSHSSHVNPADHNHNYHHDEGNYDTYPVTTEQVNVIDDNYGEYEQFEQTGNRIHRREVGEQYDNFSSVRDLMNDDTKKFNYFNFNDIVKEYYN
ncbi:uncharacterized protein LOC123266304 [Cotesia glomerata]|uniref:uncharacterized protein LOC123266304 n=1 Tax=Cotesia glomerata TaxID=32391 RepID=UPI001D02C84E|nr:uncharacterized protein LOC123266304 [Cotesia glomerata]